MRLKPPTFSIWKMLLPLIRQYRTKLCRPRKNEEKTLGQRQLKEKVIEKCGVGYGFVYFNNRLGLGSILGSGLYAYRKGIYYNG